MAAYELVARCRRGVERTAMERGTDRLAGMRSRQPNACWNGATRAGESPVGDACGRAGGA